MDQEIIPSQVDLTILRKLIIPAFNRAEINVLCFHLGLDYENFPDNKEEKILELIRYCQRNNRLQELLYYCQEKRPNTNWQRAFGSVTSSSLKAPYKGLQYFTEADADLFFGREKIVSDLFNKLKTTNLITIVGVSGSGKSSIVRAGLIPILRDNKIASDGSNRISKNEYKSIHIFTPSDDPLRALALNLLNRHYW